MQDWENWKPENIFMKGLDNHLYVMLLIISNVVALLQLMAAIKWPNIARISFSLLFGWACWVNWKTSLHTPQFYLDYAGLAWIDWYKTFILGWFAEHIKTAVGFIASCQGVIAIAMLSKGWIFKIGCFGAIIFLVAILPFGVGSGFPCTAIMAVAVYILSKKTSTVSFVNATKMHGHAMQHRA